MVSLLDGFRPYLKARWIMRYPPNDGQWKVKDDESSKDNSGPSIAVFCIRNNNGDLVSAKDSKILDVFNLVFEADRLYNIVGRRDIPTLLQKLTH